MHGVRKQDTGILDFGEMYFTSIEYGTIRGWKMHTVMISNLIVPVGKVKFVLYDDRKGSKTYKRFQEIILGVNNYCKLTIPPNVWFAFRGEGDKNLISNFSNMVHDPNEVLTKPLNYLNYDWKN